MVEHALGRTDQAAADLQKAVELDPGSFAAHYNLAICSAGACGVAELWRLGGDGH